MLRSRLATVVRGIAKTGRSVRCLHDVPKDFGGTQLVFRNLPEFGLDPQPRQKTFTELQAEWDARTPSNERHENIGLEFSGASLKGKERTRAAVRNARDPEMERQARLQQFTISYGDVKEEWRNELGPSHEKTIAEHYGIYRDLFGGGYFYPLVPVTVAYDYDEDHVTPVHTGNIIPPEDAQTSPHIEFDGKEGCFYTLIMTNPDGHLQDDEAEYLHWGVCNMTGDDVTSGELLCDYLPPFPVRGTGYHRHVFVLYQHESKLDFTKFKRTMPCSSLSKRTFSSEEFRTEFDGALTPVGLRFFQSEWDRSVSDVYHKTLDMREPAFEYMHPPFYHPPQRHYPRKEPFDRYYDRYRDKKELREEVLKMKLAMIKPNAPHPKYSRFTPVHRATSYEPTWLKRRKELIARRLEQFKDLPK